MSLSIGLSDWYARLSFDKLPADVATQTQRRVMDALGVMLAATRTSVGASVRQAAAELSGGSDRSRIVGFGDRVGPRAAALANGSLSAALDFDDTHVQTIIHTTGPALAAALALAPTHRTSGRELVAVVAGAAEAMCRIGMVAPGAWQRHGFHPTAIAGAFGAAMVAGRLTGLDAARTAHALGIVGSQAAGIMESWVDGATARYVHAGWAAEAGLTAAALARAGITGPAAVLEGRSGLFASHLPGAADDLRPGEVLDELGERWESRNVALKPYPAGHVLHSFVDAILHLRASVEAPVDEVARITCRIADYMVPLVCEPADQKRHPAGDSVARVSLYQSMAEAYALGRLDAGAYAPQALADSAIRALAGRVHYEIDETAPGRERFRGWVILETTDGRKFERIEETNRGSAERPLSDVEVAGKFAVNARATLDDVQADHLADLLLRLDAIEDVAVLLDAACSRENGETA